MGKELKDSYNKGSVFAELVPKVLPELENKGWTGGDQRRVPVTL